MVKAAYQKSECDSASALLMSFDFHSKWFYCWIFFGDAYVFLRASGCGFISNILRLSPLADFFSFFLFVRLRKLREKTSADKSHNQAMHNAPSNSPSKQLTKKGGWEMGAINRRQDRWHCSLTFVRLISLFLIVTRPFLFL
jgi:hypothetical protein